MEKLFCAENRRWASRDFQEAINSKKATAKLKKLIEIIKSNTL